MPGVAPLVPGCAAPVFSMVSMIIVSSSAYLPGRHSGVFPLSLRCGSPVHCTGEQGGSQDAGRVHLWRCEAGTCHDSSHRRGAETQSFLIFVHSLRLYASAVIV